MVTVTFLSASGAEYTASLPVELLNLLRLGYPMRGWPYPWRERTTCASSSAS